MTTKIILFAILGVFLTIMWFADFVKWTASVGKKEYWWRLADFCLTSTMIVVLIELVGR